MVRNIDDRVTLMRVFKGRRDHDKPGAAHNEAIGNQNPVTPFDATLGALSRDVQNERQKLGARRARLQKPVKFNQAPPAETKSNAGRVILFSFLFLVVLPSIGSLSYFLFMASPQYQVETKLTVRTAKSNDNFDLSTGFLGKLGINTASGSSQDALIISDYLKSRAIIEDVGGLKFLKSFYGDQKIDRFSRLDSSRGLEDALFYWRDHVTAQVDTISGIVTIRVLAFTPEGALNLGQRIIKNSEELVNRLSLKSREDILAIARQEVDRSQGELANIRSQILAFQQKTNAMSPIDTASQIGAIISSLTLRRLQIESELATAKGIGLTQRPGDAQLKVQLSVLTEELKKYENMLTGTGSNGAITNQLKDFELLKLQEEFADKIYTVARTSFEEARRDLEKQQLYLVVIVPPFLPDFPSFPKPFTNASLIFAALSILWGILALLVASIRDGLG